MSTPSSHNGGSATRLWHVLALAVMVSGLYLPQLFTGRTALDRPDKMDITLQWMPAYVVVAESYREGYFPLWNPDVFLGMPWAAYAHTAGLYPVSALLFSTIDYCRAATVSILFHSLIGALGCFFLLRVLGRSPLSCLLGALVYSQSGMAFHLINQFSALHSMAWHPWVLAFLFRMHERARLRYLVAAAFFIFLGVTGGDVEVMIYFLMMAALAVLVLFPARGPGSFKSGFLGMAVVCAAFLASLLLALPVAELAVNSIRSSSSEVAVATGSQAMNWYAYLPQLLGPFSYFRSMRGVADFNNGLSPIYLGLFPLGICLAAVFSGRDRETRRWALILGLLLAYLAIMSLDVLAPLTSRLPVLSKLASRVRMLEPIHLVMVIVFSGGLDRLLDRGARAWTTAALLGGAAVFVFATAGLTVAPVARYIFAAVTAAMAVGALVAGRSGAIGRRALSAGAAVVIVADVTLLAYWCVPRNLPSDYRLDQDTVSYLKKADPTARFLPFERLFGQGPHRPDLKGGTIFETDLNTPVGFMRLPPYRSFEYLTLANPGILMDNSRVFVGVRGDRRTMDIRSMVSPEMISVESLRLMNLAGVRYYLSRGLSLKFSDQYPLLTENALFDGDWLAWPESRGLEASLDGAGASRSLLTELPYRVDFTTYLYPESLLSMGVFGYGTGPVAVILDISGEGLSGWSFMKSVPGGGSSYPVRVPLDDAAGADRRVSLSLSGTGKARIGGPRIIRPGMPLALSREGEIDVYENGQALPRSFVLQDARELSSHGGLRKALLSPDTDLGRTVLFEGGRDSPERTGVTAGRGRGGKVLLDHRPQRVTLRAALVEPGWLVLTDSYYPGWTAREGGMELRILPADLAFRAVRLSSGPREVVMRYEPFSFRVGLWASIVTLALFAAALWAGWRKGAAS